MKSQITVNGIAIHPGAPVVVDNLQEAGLRRITAWRRWLRRLPGRYGHWQAADPSVTCFDGAIEIYACRQSYLDQDRRWGTECLVRQLGETIVGVEVSIIEGVYAAGNLFDRFVEAGCEFLGQPDQRSAGHATWRAGDIHIEAALADDARNAQFSFVAADSR